MGVEYLKLSRPFIIPSARNILLMKIVVIDKVGVSHLVEIESATCPQRQTPHAREVADVLSVQFQSRVAEVAGQPLDSLVVAHGEC